MWEYDSKEIRRSLYTLFFNTREKELQGYLEELGKKHEIERKKNEKRRGEIKQELYKKIFKKKS